MLRRRIQVWTLLLVGSTLVAVSAGAEGAGQPAPESREELATALIGSFDPELYGGSIVDDERDRQLQLVSERSRAYFNQVQKRSKAGFAEKDLAELKTLTDEARRVAGAMEKHGAAYEQWVAIPRVELDSLWRRAPTDGTPETPAQKKVRDERRAELTDEISRRQQVAPKLYYVSRIMKLATLLEAELASLSS